MQISLRSQMIAGTAAVVGASAIALTPVVAQHEMLPNVHVPSAITMTAFHSPLTEVIASLGLVNNYIFNPSFNAAAFPGLSPLIVAFGLPALGFNAGGVVPQIINDHLPIISQLGKNGSDYLYNSVKGLGTSAAVLSQGVWDAAFELLSLNITGAINTLINSVQFAGTNALAAGTYVATGVITRASAVATALAAEVGQIAQITLGQVSVLVNSVVNVATNVATALTNLDVQGAWNAAVDGLLGPTGIPGVVTSLTIGAGVQIGAFPPASGYLPSVRGEIQAAVKTVAGALATANPAPPPLAATKSAAPSASAIRKAAPAAAAVTAGSNNSPAPEAVTGGGGGGDQPSAKSSTSNGGSDRGVSRASKHSAG